MEFIKLLYKKNFVIILLFFTNPVYSLEFVLNDRSLNMFTNEQLANLVYPDVNMYGKKVLLVSELFPWMEQVSSVEIQTKKQIILEGMVINEEIWNQSQFFYNENTLEIQIGEKRIGHPERLSITGKILNVPEIRFWEAGNYPFIKKAIKVIIDLRKVRGNWRKVYQPEYLLSDPPEGELPHIVLLNDISFISQQQQFSDYKVIKSELTDAQFNTQGQLKQPDLPESTLYWYLFENPTLFDIDGKLSKNLMSIMRIMPISRTNLRYNKRVGIVRRTYAAIPKGLVEEDDKIAHLILYDMKPIHVPIRNLNNVKEIPMTPETTDYFDTYLRIGRLVISKQMETQDALIIMDDYSVNKGGKFKSGGQALKY